APATARGADAAGWGAGPGGEPGDSPAARSAGPVPDDPDATMELPIFRQVNEWFGPERSGAGRPAAPAAIELATQRVSPGQICQQRQPTGESSAARRARKASQSWQARSDEAWRAAIALSSQSAESTTPAGLPQRVPQRHLVPPVVDSTEQQSATNRRDPTVVAAALSAYARGVAGRHLPPAPIVPASPTGSRP
ncbi:MAG: hypothetical protein HKP61_14465, partial [Dactylosporangium sp.]|nr:hypothetical protein [Dactylosporangium sp.]NNJ62115.1 hypothetical protein [Dactylosporangium sp.]